MYYSFHCEKSHTQTKETEMQLRDIIKVEEGRYSVSSLPCPMCDSVLNTEISGEQVFAWHKGLSSSDVLPDLSLEDRERFISGYCGSCWKKIF
jgi:hypothetical protein